MAALLVLTVMLLCCAYAQDPKFTVSQPTSVSAVVGRPVILSCKFSYPPYTGPLEMSVYWRIGNFHGAFIYNRTKTINFTRQDYKGRISLVGDPQREKTASIRITDLREKDSTFYFCRVQVKQNNGNTEQWQSIPGTHLSVSVQTSTTIQSDTSTRICTTRGPTSTAQTAVGDTKGPQELIPVISGVVVGILLLICVIGLTCFLLRRSRGRRQADKGIKEASQKEASQPEMYVSVRKTESRQPAQFSPKSLEEVQLESALVYASLNLKSSSTARKKELRAPLPEETLYAAVRHGAPS
uniref:paired immunoglobulin-like type 2 receptor alpha isoform X2 n=1 Tax=Geotrypetes seraphini TaxID=260995 RepID=UPI001458749A|nr:paired immunoglobulin-like type 2 receptor alpha isoform X2 [Geotrypetes seraphini]